MNKKSKDIPQVALLIDQSREYERKLMAGIQRYIHLHGPWMLYRISPFYVSGQDAFSIDDLIKWKPDGIIVRENYYLPQLLKTRIPLIYCGYDKIISSVPGIYANDKAIGKMGAEYFINKGYRHFAFCSMEGYYWSEERLNAFRTRVEKEHYTIHIYHHSRPKGKESWQHEPTKIAQWLKTLPKPLALMSATDDLSLQILEASKIAGILIPEEVAILGVDNDESICTTSHPTLSSIDQNPEWAGFEAGELLSKMMNGKINKLENIVADPKKVVTRHSTSILAIEDQLVASMLHFINENAANKSLSVDETACQAGLSRRMLEIRFRKALQKTVHDVITEARVKRFKQLLAESTMTVSQISVDTGCSGADSLSRIFKKSTGLTPLEYRLKQKQN